MRFIFVKTCLKRADIKKTLQFIKRLPRKNLSYYRGGTYLFSRLLATTCP